MKAAELAEKFDTSFALVYDAKVRATVPGYEEVHRMALSFFAPLADRAARLLLVGAGAGMETVAFAKAFRHARLTALDPSPQMLDIARARVKKAGLQNVDFVEGLCTDLAPDERYDGATSILVMHFVPDDGSKKRFLSEIYERLKPGARLVLVDLHGDTSASEFESLYGAWISYLHLTRYDTADMKADLAKVHFVPESRIETLLTQVGFVQPQRFYSAYLFGGWVAVRK